MVEIVNIEQITYSQVIASLRLYINMSFNIFEEFPSSEEDYGWWNLILSVNNMKMKYRSANSKVILMKNGKIMYEFFLF